MNVTCTIITKPIKELAAILGLSPEVTNNLISTWQTESGKHVIPTVQVLQRYKESKRDQLNDIALAIPTYTVVKNTSPKETSASIVKNADGTMSVVLHTFGEGYDANSLRVWSYSRSINNNNRAKSISLTIDKDSKIKLMGDSYVTSFTNEDKTNSNIDFNGYKLYVKNISIN